jgi:YhcG PDDEXK nuclease domain
LPDEQPSIGIILCKAKDRMIVDYALRQASMPIGVAAYQITSSVPVGFQGQLPDPDQVAALLAGIDGEGEPL